jgi:hypothetical protein
MSPNYTPINQRDIPHSPSSPDLEAQNTPWSQTTSWSLIQPSPDPETIDYKFTLFGKICLSIWFLAFYSLILFVGYKAVSEDTKKGMTVGILAPALFMGFMVSREKETTLL